MDKMQDQLQIFGKGKVTVGQKTHIDKTAQIYFQGEGCLELGDYVNIGAGVRLIVGSGNVKIGDWTTIHNESLVLGGQGVDIGEHCWFGQSTVIDGTGELLISSGVRVGMYSQIWTHVAAGERIEGCTLFGQNKVEIHKDAWLVGSCTVSPGVVIGERAVCLTGSVLTKSIPDRTTWSGVPAKLMENRLFYKQVTLDEKWKMLSQWVVEFSNDMGMVIKFDDSEISLTHKEQTFIFVKLESDLMKHLNNNRKGIACVETKTYVKSLSELEQSILKYLSSNMARFLSYKA